MTAIWDTANFLQKVRRRMRFGELSREPLRLLRFEIRQNWVECEWVIRPSDAWDQQLPCQVREENLSHQAIRDALKMRELVFRMFPQVQSARLSAYREHENQEHELIMTGMVTREDEAPPRIASLVMRAKLCGFRFLLNDGVLQAIA